MLALSQWVLIPAPGGTGCAGWLWPLGCASMGPRPGRQYPCGAASPLPGLVGASPCLLLPPGTLPQGPAPSQLLVPRCLRRSPKVECHPQVFTA